MKLKLFAPNLNVIFGITASSNLIINKFMHERGGVPQLDKYRYRYLAAESWLFKFWPCSTLGIFIGSLPCKFNYFKRVLATKDTI